MTNLESISRLVILYTIISELSTLNLKEEKYFFISLDRIVNGDAKKREKQQGTFPRCFCGYDVDWGNWLIQAIKPTKSIH